VHSNLHFKGCFQSAFSVPAQFVVCELPFSNFHFSPYQIDTSRNLKSHLNHCKHNASLFSDRQNIGRISLHLVCRYRRDPVDVDPAASNPPFRSSNVRSMLYSLYPKTHNHFAAGEIR
jgi:hypothetical protein